MTEQLTDLNIHQRLLKVTSEVDAIPKNGYNSFSKYHYVRAVDAIGHVKKLLIKYGISLTIDEIECDRLSKKEDGKNFHTKLKCQAIFCCADNPADSHVVIYYTVSADTLDKDIFKAKTNGLKYLFSQQFLMVTDDFIDTEDDRVEDPKNQKPLTITDEQLITLREICDSKGFPIDATLERLAVKIFNIKKIDELPRDGFEKAKEFLNKQESK